MSAATDSKEHVMSIVVAGAAGHLGRDVVAALLARGVPAGQIVATARRPEVLADFAEQGVVVRFADHDDPASLTSAFAGARRLLLISGNAPGAQLAQHRNVIEAAREAGVELFAYTSILQADSSTLLLVPDHRATEQMLAGSGVPHAILRNGWYFENWTDQLATYLEHGIAGAAGEGRVSAAARADFADAAAAVLTSDGHAGAIYELGAESFTLTEFAAALSAALGRTITYTDLPVEQYEQVLIGAGFPAPYAAIYADADRGIAAGELYTDAPDLEKLLGRAPLTLGDELARLKA
jgi:NAD(P)H dehydrogenase (quinone)